MPLSFAGWGGWQDLLPHLRCCVRRIGTGASTGGDAGAIVISCDRLTMSTAIPPPLEPLLVGLQPGDNYARVGVTQVPMEPPLVGQGRGRGRMPRYRLRPPQGPQLASAAGRTVHQENLVYFISWKDDTKNPTQARELGASKIKECTMINLDVVGNIRPDWLLNKRGDDTDMQYLGDQNAFYADGAVSKFVKEV